MLASSSTASASSSIRDEVHRQTQIFKHGVVVGVDPLGCAGLAVSPQGRAKER
jgi:hypothetical protein